MGKLSTHVLDTANGCPAAGMQVTLMRLNDAGSEILQTFDTDDDGRAPAPLLQGADLQRGRYRLIFAVAPYFRARGALLPEPPFVDEVQLDFGIAEPDSHYHVPLLVSPWSYSTYRGS